MNEDRAKPDPKQRPLPIPRAHLAFINAVHLSPYAFQPLHTQQKTGERLAQEDLQKDSQERGKEQGPSAWQICLDKLQHLPRDTEEPIPTICLLPPLDSGQGAKPERTALRTEHLQEQGIHAIRLQNYSEGALLQAIQQGIEYFYSQAFRPDPTAKSLEKYLGSLENTGNGSWEAPQFCETVELPLALRYHTVQLEPIQSAEDFTSRQIHCYWLEGDAPFVSLALSQKLYQAHHRFAAELSYADMYPQGLVPVLFQAAILGRLWHLHRKSQVPFQSGQEEVKASKTQLAPQTPHNSTLPGILEIAERDLNLFAAEPLPGEKDYRQLRLDLRSSSKRQFLILENLYRSLAAEPIQPGHTKFWPDQPILAWLEKTNLRSLPRYFPIQISALCPQRCSYCPYPQLANPGFFPSQGKSFSGKTSKQIQSSDSAAFMAPSLWEQLLAAIANFTGDAVINLSPLGEALLHPQFPSLVQSIWQYPDLHLVIETSGAQWQTQDIEFLLRLNYEQTRITWIVSLDALNPELYRQLRAPDEKISPDTGMTPSQKNAHDLVQLLLHSEYSLPQQVYVQAVRMKENEDDLEAFYHYWVKGRKPSKGPFADSTKDKINRPQVIVQKYNSYAGFLPERQLVRLDPVERFPCRRLAREMVLGPDGQAYLCVQDLQRQFAGQLELSLGQFPNQGLEKLWQQGYSLYQRHIEKAYPELCQNCDEYYVYNF